MHWHILLHCDEQSWDDAKPHAHTYSSIVMHCTGMMKSSKSHQSGLRVCVGAKRRQNTLPNCYTEEHGIKHTSSKQGLTMYCIHRKSDNIKYTQWLCTLYPPDFWHSCLRKAQRKGIKISHSWKKSRPEIFGKWCCYPLCKFNWKPKPQFKWHPIDSKVHLFLWILTAKTKCSYSV